MNLNKKSKVVLIITSAIVIWGCFFATDYYLAKNNKVPIFCLPGSMLKDGGTRAYYGLGYKIIKYNQLMGRKDAVIGLWGLKF